MNVGIKYITDWKHNKKLVKLRKIKAIHLGKASKGLRKVTSPHDVCFSIIKKKTFGRETLDFETKRLSHRTYVIFNIIENMQSFGLSAEKVEMIKSMVLSNENQDEILKISLDPQKIATLSANGVNEPQIKMETTEWIVSWHNDGKRPDIVMVIDWETITVGNADTKILNLIEIEEIHLWNGTDGFQDDGGPSNVSFSIVPYSEETGWKTLGFEMKSAEDRSAIIIDILDKLQCLGVYPVAEDGLTRQVVLDGMKSDKTMQIRVMHYADDPPEAVNVINQNADESDDSGDIEKGFTFPESTTAVDNASAQPAQGRNTAFRGVVASLTEQIRNLQDGDTLKMEMEMKVVTESNSESATAKSQEMRSRSHDVVENPDTEDLVSVREDHLEDPYEIINYENIDMIRIYDKDEIYILGIRTSTGMKHRIKLGKKKCRDNIAVKLITKMDTFGKTAVDDDVDSLKEQIRNLQSGDILRIKLETRTRAHSKAESTAVSSAKSKSVESVTQIDRINDRNEAVTWSRQQRIRIMNGSEEVASVVNRPQIIGENVPKELEEKCNASDDSGDIEKGLTFPESSKAVNIPVNQTGSFTATKCKDIANIRLNQENSLFCVSITTATGKMHRFASGRKESQQQVFFGLIKKMEKLGKMPINQDIDTIQHRITNLGKDDVFDITYHQFPSKLESVVESVTETEPLPESSLSTLPQIPPLPETEWKVYQYIKGEKKKTMIFVESHSITCGRTEREKIVNLRDIQDIYLGKLSEGLTNAMHTNLSHDVCFSFIHSQVGVDPLEPPKQLDFEARNAKERIEIVRDIINKMHRLGVYPEGHLYEMAVGIQSDLMNDQMWGSTANPTMIIHFADTIKEKKEPLDIHEKTITEGDVLDPITQHKEIENVLSLPVDRSTIVNPKNGHGTESMEQTAVSEEKCDELEDSEDIEKGFTFPESTKNMEIPSALEGSESPPFERFSKMPPHREKQLKVYQDLKQEVISISASNSDSDATRSELKELRVQKFRFVSIQNKLLAEQEIRKKENYELQQKLTAEIEKNKTLSDQMNVQFEETNSKVKALESDLDDNRRDLKEQRAQCEQYLHENGVMNDQNHKLQEKLASEIEKAEVLRKKLSDIREEVASHQREVVHLRVETSAEIEQLRSTLDANGLEIGSLTERICELQDSISEKDTEIMEQREELERESMTNKQLLEKQSMVEKENHELRKTVLTEIEKSENLRSQMDFHQKEADKEIHRLKSDLDDSARELADLQLETTEVQENLAMKLKESMIVNKNAIHKLEDLVAARGATIEKLKSDLSRMEKMNSQLTEDIDENRKTLQCQLTMAESGTDELNEVLRAKIGEIEQLKSELDDSRQELTDKIADIKRLRRARKDMKRNFKDLSERNQQLQDSSSVLKATITRLQIAVSSTLNTFDSRSPSI